MLGFINKGNKTFCTVSIIGRVAFNVAASFWVVFITRLVYIEALAPGKYYNIVTFMVKNFIFTYIPSLIVSAFLLIIIYLTNTASE